MNPLYLFPLALIVPFVVAIVAFVPAYAGLFGAAYLIYDQPDVANPLSPYMFDIFYVFEVYGRLFDHWSGNIGGADFVAFTLPIVGLPLLGFGLSAFLTYKLVASLVNFFRMASIT